MRVMIFIDDSNFKANIECIRIEKQQDRIIDYHKIHTFVLDYLSKNSQYKDKTPLLHVRTYLYVGEYTDPLFKRIRYAITESHSPDKEKFERLLTGSERHREGQRKFLAKTMTFNFFEIRKKPLQFTKQSKRVFQKGVDVQLAVDLVSNAYLNTYDIAVLFSGDIDLLESLKLIKSLGKHIIIISHYKNVAKEMVRESDLLVDLQKVDDEILNKFSHIFEMHEDKIKNTSSYYKQL